ncbi:hypothetical protein HPB48_008027 [Haemaphysalis longicornis]|uniref:Uncharacterized protein n=1 Tax=Haemaphysalis longicornis TaxID=44386 RepID=A0A9J6G015_HAELO|nr:hypothetical protein HPB48_008027 [Haemaphysalis longicornis]
MPQLEPDADWSERGLGTDIALVSSMMFPPNCCSRWEPAPWCDSPAGRPPSSCVPRQPSAPVEQSAPRGSPTTGCESGCCAVFRSRVPTAVQLSASRLPYRVPCHLPRGVPCHLSLGDAGSVGCLFKDPPFQTLKQEGPSISRIFASRDV